MQSFIILALLLHTTIATSLALNSTIISDIIHNSNLTTLSVPLTRYHFRSVIDDAVYRVRQQWPNAELTGILGTTNFPASSEVFDNPSQISKIWLYFLDPPRGTIHLHIRAPEPGRPIAVVWPPVHHTEYYVHNDVPKPIDWPSQEDLWDAYDRMKKLAQGQLQGFFVVQYQRRCYPPPLGWQQVYTFLTNVLYQTRLTLRTDTNALIDPAIAPVHVSYSDEVCGPHPAPVTQS